MSTITERRRNMRAEPCRACGTMCDAGNGYLYKDTNTHRRNRYTGRFLWFVKCEDCHSGAKTRMTVEMEKQAAARADEPVVRPWSVSQVKKWVVSRTTHEGDVAIRIDGSNFSEIVSYLDYLGRFTAPTGYAMEQMVFGGKPLSEKASAHLSEQVLRIVDAVSREEKESGELAVSMLVSAGAKVTPHLSGFGWSVEYNGGQYTLFGCVGGKNQINGVPQAGRWIETTAESLIRE